MKFYEIFEYLDYIQETPTSDRCYYDCIFLQDFGPFKRGDMVPKICIDWDDYTMWISIDDQIYQFVPSWNFVN